MSKAEDKYGILYFVSNYFEVNIEAFGMIKVLIGRNGNLNRSGKN